MSSDKFRRWLADRLAHPTTTLAVTSFGIRLGQDLRRYRRREIDQRELHRRTRGHVGSALGTVTGATIGALVGQVIPGVGHVLGSFAGGVVGDIVGEQLVLETFPEPPPPRKRTL